MWIGAIESGHDRPTRVVLRTMELFSRMEVPAVLKVLFYRHRFFGSPLSELIQQAMRGPSFWTVAEREIFATATSQANECPFCASAHHAIAGVYTDINVVRLALADGDVSPLRPEAQAMLDFLRKMTRDPDGLTTGDADKIRHAGVSAEAFDEAVWVGTTFNVINRLMNTVGADPLESRDARVSARFIKAAGYKVPPPVRLFSRGV
ncbi:carboxymuconolactone decarboxylase family protein [Nocardia brasiliensis]|uniref:carboxymuconolactone decarboxylase family protein n=1 Tax=Nocardia brasiliensis TaxID=37326 RepID=UPI0036717824